MDIAAIRAALAAAVGTISGIQTFAYVPDQVVAPAFAAGEVELDYNRTFKGGGAGLTELLCKGRLYASRVDPAAGQVSLDSYLAPSGAASIKAAIEADLTLGGTCRTLLVERVHAYGQYTIGADEYYGAQFDVRVWAL
jgi:hypothetical protein